MVSEDIFCSSAPQPSSYQDGGRAGEPDEGEGPIHQGRELGVVVVEPAAVDHGADDVGDGEVDGLRRVQRFSWNSESQVLTALSLTSCSRAGAAPSDLSAASAPPSGGCTPR